MIGNTILLKHAPQCPESSAAIETIYRDAGLPEGAYTNLYATNEQAADGHRRPARAGRLGDRLGARRRGRRRGRRAQPQEGRARARRIGSVHPAVDRRPRRRRAGRGRRAPGQHRAVVQRARSASSSSTTSTSAFLEKFTAAMTGAKLGDPFADDTVLGPLSSRDRGRAPRGAGRQGRRAGRDASSPAARATARSIPATVLTDVTPEMDAYREEFFGPVGVVYRVADEDEAVKIANDTPLRARLVRLHDRRGAGRARRRQDRRRHGLRQRRARGLARAAVRRRQAQRHRREMGLLAADEFVNKKLIRVAG